MSAVLRELPAAPAASPSGERLLQLIEQQVRAQQLALPMLPEVAQRIGGMARRDDIQFAVIAAVIAKDPACSAQIMRVANSAAMQGNGGAVSSLQLAVTRLGLDLTRALVMRMAMDRMFRARSPLLNKILMTTWTRSLWVAALSRVLAARYTRVNPDAAMLAGLLHLVGSLPMIQLLDREPQLVDSGADMLRSILTLHWRVAHLVLEAWNFPPELRELPAQAFDFSRRHDGPADAADVVSLAILQTYGDDYRHWVAVDPQQVDAFRQLGLQPGSPQLQETHAAFKNSMQLLNG
ncbi:MAG TPA: HDOD domain-containing protein [Nevskiaceae bacterium]|nr:HDOD domain-containing protein [Nevskiaceae bacterium]